MFVMKKRKCYLTAASFIFILFVSKSCADDSLQVGKDSTDQRGDSAPDVSKTQDTKLGESDKTPVLDKPSDLKGLEKSESQVVQSNAVEDKGQNNKVEDSGQPGQAVEATNKENVKLETNEQLPVAQNEKSEDAKLEAVETPSEAVDAKKTNSKEDESNHKINLNDVNSYTADDVYENSRKRETRHSEFLGLPRDSSYFFDDLEPFINNNSDNRVGRAVPQRETKGQKSRASGKVKENMEDDVEEDEEEIEEEEDKNNEDEYDDDEDNDSDCQPTSKECPTTTPPCSTTTTPCSTTKSTTELKCPTSCRATKPTPKCPRICAKANRKAFGYPPTTEKQINWDADKKKIINRKKKFHSKMNPGY